MIAITNHEETTTNISRANVDGGDYTVARIDDDVVCSECGCYVDELDTDVYRCFNHGVIHA